MKTAHPNLKKTFIGRVHELEILEKLKRTQEPKLLIVYGRRRVGKTELIEHVFTKRNLLKFEGIQGYPQSKQQKIVLQQLSEYVEDTMIRDLKCENWIDIFKYIHKYTQNGPWTIYFEELQWLSDYEDDFVSELKYAWDNFFRLNPECIVVLCGSATSFMINKVVRSKALYNRSQEEIHLQEFSLQETRPFFPKGSLKEVMDAYLCVGGIPEYLNRLKENSSIFLSLCDHSFKANSFFSKEYERIFISNFAENPNYQKIIHFLSVRKFATREEILKHLKISSGGRLTELLDDLQLCGFIESYVPYHLTGNSKLKRYCIKDQYLQFYYKFIQPIEKEIQNGIYNKNPSQGINHTTLQKWLGFAFERYCRQNHNLIAKLLGFSNVRYRSGSYFSKSTIEAEPGFQIDLVFDRDDNVITVCEIKYTGDQVSTKVIQEVEKKLEFFPPSTSEKKTIQKVLISTYGAQEQVMAKGYFDYYLTLKDLFAN
jgi:AAA+ ATPase superfamily predicted ATPase